MNQPMRAGAIKNIYGKAKGIQLPNNVKKLLIGAEIVWFDSDPLSQNMDDALHFYFNSKTNIMTDMLLKKHGLTDVSQYVNIPVTWQMEIELHYGFPNGNPSKRHCDLHMFKFHGTIFPMCEKFKSERDRFYMATNMEYLAAPEDCKNKKKYATTKFRGTVINV